MTDSNTNDESVPEEDQKNGHRTIDAIDWVAAYVREARVEEIDGDGNGNGDGQSVRIIELGGAEPPVGVWTDRDKVPKWIDAEMDLPVTSTSVKHRLEGR